MTKPIHVFVYGTLRQHERNHHLLHGATCLAKHGWTHGVLYDTGLGYPAMAQHKLKRVYGELYKINQEQLQALDHLEGYVGKGKSNHYERLTQEIYTDHGTFEAEVYVFSPTNVNQLEEIPYGDWKCHQYLEQDKFLYFAYGSCMDDERFRLAGVHEQFQQIKGCGLAKHFSVAYTHRATDGGRADMIESDQWVEGKVYEINKETLIYLFKREGVHTNVYRPAFIDVEIDGILYHPVLTFLVIEKCKEEAPPMHYANEIFRGAKGFVSDVYYRKLQEDLRKKFKIM